MIRRAIAKAEAGLTLVFPPVERDRLQVVAWCLVFAPIVLLGIVEKLS